MNRRRFLRVTAAAGMIAASPARAFRLEPVEWRGIALGAPALLVIHHEDRALAMRLAAACMSEVARLERIFSLYRPDSALARLNRDGRLDTPPFELVELLSLSDRHWRLSGGAFDPTVQPLWDLYAGHFSTAGADPAGPCQAEVERTLATVGWPAVSYGPDAIVLGRTGMALTLNGIAQGYVTDRVAALLRNAGLRHVLVDMGEIAVLGRRGDGAPWRVELPGGQVMRMASGAVAVSDPDGTRFSPFCHHIFDPATGRCAARAGAVSKLAASATEADALSTAAIVGQR